MKAADMIVRLVAGCLGHNGSTATVHCRSKAWIRLSKRGNGLGDFFYVTCRVGRTTGYSEPDVMILFGIEILVFVGRLQSWARLGSYSVLKNKGRWCFRSIWVDCRRKSILGTDSNSQQATALR